MSMPRPKSEQPHDPRSDTHHGKACFVSRWRTDGPPRRHHSKRFYVKTLTQAQREFRAWLAVWKADPRIRDPHRPGGMTVRQLADLYVQWAQTTFVKRGKPTTHAGKISRAADLFCELYAGRACHQVTAPDLASWRDWAIGGTKKSPARSRATVNAFLGCIKSMYQWAAECGLIEPSVCEAIAVVSWLKKGRSHARESKHIESVALDIVEATAKQLADQLAAMVWLQWYSGMRPDEVCSMRAIDIDRAGEVWVYRPAEHKLSHHEGVLREVALGPRAIEIVQQRLNRMGYLFRPSEAAGAHDAGKRYSVAAYRRAIARACDRASVPRWSPNMLRHAYATRGKQEMGVDASRAALGHASADTTQVYLDRDRKLAIELAKRIG